MVEFKMVLVFLIDVLIIIWLMFVYLNGFSGYKFVIMFSIFLNKYLK